MQQTTTAKQIVTRTLRLLGFPQARVSVSREAGVLSISIQADEAGLLIGKGGENLRALQHLLLIMVSRTIGERFSPGGFSLDINDYKKERHRYLASLARSVADEVQESGERKQLEPMPASERRIIHLTIASIKGVETESRGRRAKRHVIVRPSAF